MSKDCVTTALFKSHADAVNAIHKLETMGFSENDISVLMSDASGDDFKIASSSKMPEGAATGAASGGMLGALIAGLTAVGTITTGGAGVLAAGPIVAALAGAGAGSAAGGVLGALVGLGINEHEAKTFASEQEDGTVLVAVKCENSDRRSLADEVLKDCCAADVAHS